jgi:hypothetical protein
MTQITIQVPDDLVQYLEPIQDRLPALLMRLVESISSAPAISDLAQSSNSPIQALDPSIQTLPAYEEVLDLLVAQPTPEQITTFKASEASQTRLRTLLDKNREASLSQSEAVELNLYEQLDQLMTLLKARAHAAKSSALLNERMILNVGTASPRSKSFLKLPTPKALLRI